MQEKLKNTLSRKIWGILTFALLLGSIWQCQRPLSSSHYEPVLADNDSVPPAVIFLIGDGMGLTQLSAAIYSRKSALPLEEFTHIGFHKPYSSSQLVTDSAAGATAFACGVKTYNGAIGVNADTLPCLTLLEEAEARQLATGLIVTSTVVHATPASFAAHQRLRVMYEDIALDMTDSGVDFLIGGGKRYFDRRKEDDRDLLAELQSRGYMVRDYFDGELSSVKPDTALGFAFFTADNQPLPVNQGRTYLSYATHLGTWYLDRKGKDKGFFLMVEGSQIDWANHANEGRLAIQETLDFNRAIGEAVEFARQRGNTLVLVTADHESGGMAIQPDSKMGRIKPAFTTNGHTGTLVPVFAFGPGAEKFRGIYENTDIYHKIRQFYGWEHTSETAQANN